MRWLLKVAAEKRNRSAVVGVQVSSPGRRFGGGDDRRGGLAGVAVDDGLALLDARAGALGEDAVDFDEDEVAGAAGAVADVGDGQGEFGVVAGQRERSTNSSAPAANMRRGRVIGGIKPSPPRLGWPSAPRPSGPTTSTK